MEVTMEKYGFIYLWYDRKRKMFYLGSHWGTIDDGYICSSNRMRDAYRRRPNDFKRRILKINVSRETLLDEEHKLLSKIHDVELGKRYYNLRKHKWGHWSTDENKRLSVGQKISEKNKGRETPWMKRPKSKETKEKLSLHFKGRKIGPMDEEHKKKISEGNKGVTRKRSPEAIAKSAASNTGKKRTPETREKLRIAALKRYGKY
jgi:hypothetical protein